MLQNIVTRSRSGSASQCFAALLGASLSECMSSSERRHVDLQQDAATCAAFGAQYGSPQYNDCMLAQQRRRDVQRLEALDRTRLTSQIAREAQAMTERARKQRCERDPDRRECWR
jgi:hypothetical protein